MKRTMLFLTLLIGGIVLGLGIGVEFDLNSEALAKPKAPRDNMVKGELFPLGYTPAKIKNGMYPRNYSPNTELLGSDEMRVVALGTGMPNVISCIMS